MAGAPVRLSESERSIVDIAIRDHASHRGWQIHALNVRMTHVHVVVACDLKPELATGQFKSWATRRLREAKVRPDTRIWTREGSTRYLFDHTGLARAIDYVLNQQ
jgi:REP element-mobilizing transposase RayT